VLKLAHYFKLRMSKISDEINGLNVRQNIAISLGSTFLLGHSEDLLFSFVWKFRVETEIG